MEVKIIGKRGSLRPTGNSDIILDHALQNAIEEGAVLSEDFDGVLLSTPVYFGRYSSEIRQFIQGTDLMGKAVGCLSVGAKRNGGQETTILFALYDCLVKGAIVTGNGSPTGQFGGTAWAGNVGAVKEDEFGLETVAGTGRRLVDLVRLMNTPQSLRMPNLLFITKDTIDALDIEPCRACPVCPNGDLDADYTCCVKDGMVDFQEKLAEADGIIFYSSANDSDKFFTFLERTRFIRRNHFELQNKIGSAIGDPIFKMQSLSFFLRQNMFVAFHPMTFGNAVYRSMQYRTETHSSIKYVPVGYQDAKDGALCYRD